MVKKYITGDEIDKSDITNKILEQESRGFDYV